METPRAGLESPALRRDGEMLWGEAGYHRGDAGITASLTGDAYQGAELQGGLAAGWGGV